MSSRQNHLLSCLDCKHCHVYYIDKIERRFYCDTPTSHSCYITNPAKIHIDLCEDFCFSKRTPIAIKINMCEKLQSVLLKEEVDEKGFFQFDKHNQNARKDRIVVHHHINNILQYVEALESNKAVVHAKDLVDSYFKMAAYGFQRIAEIEIS